MHKVITDESLKYYTFLMYVKRKYILDVPIA